tara:strand:- start:122988 stop:123770 length:783 start_codon:yes stop_codon:yes gene_type:complete
MQNKIVLIAIVFFTIVAQSYAQENVYAEASFIKELDTLKYRILYPKNFSDTNKYPVVFFLHGAGERGEDNQKQLVHGSGLFSKAENLENFPAIIIFPQCATEDYWSNAKVKRNKRPFRLKFNYNRKPTKAMTLMMDLVDETLAKPFVKADQVYVMGLSMGGMGTFELLHRKPTVFAAAIAICGGGQAKGAKDFFDTPLWVFHGANDDVVNPELSIEMVSALLKYGGKPKFTMYDKANHNSWDPAFAEPDLLPWLFSNKLK